MIKLFDKIKKCIFNTGCALPINYIIDDVNTFYYSETEILNQSIDNFDTHVKYLKNNFELHHKLGSEKSDFALFDPNTQNFSDMVTLEKRMETYIRDDLVLGTIHKLFKLYNINCLWPTTKIKYPHNNPGVTDQSPLAFIVCNNGYNIGYRLSDYEYNEINEIKRIVKSYDIRELVIIRIDEIIKYYKCDDYDLGISNKEIAFRDFFNMYFLSSNFDNYLEKCRKKIKWANNYLGLHVVPSWSGKTNYITHRNVLNRLLKNLNDNGSTLKYKKITEELAIDKYNYEYCLSQDEIKYIESRIYDKKMFNYLLGNNKCAQSLVSSEYLYDAIINESNISAINTDNYGFDFTVIACGYLKSIEQLLFIIFDMYTVKHNNEYFVSEKYNYTDILKKLKYNGKLGWWVRKESRNDKDKLLDLGNLIYFLHLNLYSYFFSRSLEEKLFHQLLLFSRECRNGYFHKHNIEKLNILKDVRDNAFYLITIILGGYSFEDINVDYKKERYFNYHNWDYEELYSKLYEHSNYVQKFSVLFDNKKIDVHLKERINEPIYDCENGFIKQKSILMFSDDDNSQIVINESNMPKQMWYKKKGSAEDNVEIHW